MLAKTLTKPPTIGEFLKEIRAMREWSQCDLANALGVNQSYISMLESTEYFKKPPLDFMKALSDSVLLAKEKKRMLEVLYAELDRYIEG